MDISEKKIEEVAAKAHESCKHPVSPFITKAVLEAANITGKDGLLDVLGEMTYLVSSLAKHAPMLLPKEEEAIKRANDHLSQWSQK